MLSLANGFLGFLVDWCYYLLKLRLFHFFEQISRTEFYHTLKHKSKRRKEDYKFYLKMLCEKVKKLD